jgi:hypothetical protein
MNSALERNNFIVIPGFISHHKATMLAKRFTDYVNQNRIGGDPQAPQSPSMYDYMPFVRMLVEKIPLVTELLQEPVLPTYTYARSYVGGEVLERHRDRAACEISLTVNLFKDKDWDIFVQRPDNSEAKVNLEPGDAILYKGCEADHWREAFQGSCCVQVFMHYVRAHGDNAWAYFDKKQ